MHSSYLTFNDNHLFEIMFYMILIYIDLLVYTMTNIREMYYFSMRFFLIDGQKEIKLCSPLNY